MTRKIAASPDEMPDRGEVLSRSGLEFMLDVLGGRLPGPPIGDALGFFIAAVEPGRVVFEGASGFGGTNVMGGTHGGWYGAILDSCMACAVMTGVPRGAWYTTLEYKVNITRALPPGMMARAVGTVSHVGRSTGVASGELRGVDDGRLYATGSTTCIIMGG